MLMKTLKQRIVFTGLLIPFLMAGCPGNLSETIEDILDDLEIDIEAIVGDIQGDGIILPGDLIDNGGDIILIDDADVIVDISDELVYDELDDITLLIFDNYTPYDVYLEYEVVDDFTGDVYFQSEFILSGDALIIEYFCLDSVELLYEEDYDALGFVQSFDLTGLVVFNPEDFFCGEAVVVEIYTDDVIFRLEPIDLTSY
jgi:hypothetical protein